MSQDLIAIFFLLFTLILLATMLVNVFVGGPYLPTRKKRLDAFLDLGKLKKGMEIVDLGCGDGRLLFRAEKKYGVVGIGYEIAPLPYLMAQIKRILFRSKVKIYYRSFLKIDLNKFDVIFCYLVPEIMKKVANKLEGDCSKKRMLVSQTFKLPGFKGKKVGRYLVYRLF